VGSAAPGIEVRGLVKAYGGRRVLDELDLDVRAGETLVILGGSGSGKSTLLRCLIGLERPDAGSVKIGGQDIFDIDEASLARLRRRMGVAFQGGALFGSMTVAENVELPIAELTDLPRETRRIMARLKLGMVGLEDASERYPSELSGGMVKRAALARALALDPDVLFFDEPSAGLDPMTGAGVDELFLKLREIFDVTIVVVTHELQSAFRIATRIALLHRGRFVVVDEPAAVRAIGDPLVRDFLDRRVPQPGDRAAKLQRLLDEERL
jgi:phospholipid/cholesterol/gamma-HCH transport system ATP-binding protein